MAELTLAKMKKVQILLFVVVILMLLFGGCGTQESGGSARLEDMAVPMSGGVDINAIGTGEWAGSQGLNGAESFGGTESGAGAAGNPANDLNSRTHGGGRGVFREGKGCR